MSTTFQAESVAKTSSVRAKIGASSQRSVSIIMSVGDDERFIRNSISGILSQETDAPVELIAVCKRSGGNALELLRDLTGGRLAVSVVGDPDDRDHDLGARASGGGLWLAEGLGVAKGDYVIPLRARDWWSSPHLLADQIEILDGSRMAVACAAACVENDVQSCGFVLRPFMPLPTGTMITTNEILVHYCFGHLSGVMFRREALESVPRDIYRLAFFERFVAALASRGGIFVYLEESAVVERVNVDLDKSEARKDLAVTEPNLLRLTSAAALFSALTDFDILTERRWKDAVRIPQEHALANLRS